MSCERCGNPDRAEGADCPVCGWLDDASFEAALEKRAGLIRSTRIAEVAGVGGIVLFSVVGVITFFVVSPVVGMASGAAAIGSFLAAAHQSERRAPYKLIRSLSEAELADAERKALPTVGGTSTPVAFPSND
jgi:hypothetical protein